MPITQYWQRCGYLTSVCDKEKNYFIGTKIFVQESHLLLRQEEFLCVWQILATGSQHQAVVGVNWAVDEWGSSMKPSLLGV